MATTQTSKNRIYLIRLQALILDGGLVVLRNVIPNVKDVSMEADIYRLRMYRNKISHISTTTEIQWADFRAMWTEIEMILLRLNASVKNPVPNLQQIIDDCYTIRLHEEAYEKIIDVKEGRAFKGVYKIQKAQSVPNLQQIIDDCNTIRLHEEADEKTQKEVKEGRAFKEVVEIRKDDDFYKRVLGRSQDEILHRLDPEPVLDLFNVDGCLSDTQLHDIQEHKYRIDRVRALLEVVSSKGTSGYKSFQSALIECGQGYIAVYLDNEEAALEEKEMLMMGCSVTPPGTSMSDNDILPNAVGLAALCQALSRNSDTVKHICDKICDNIKDECKHVVNVWPSYRPNEENIIVFCVITDIPCERISCVYSIVQRSIGEYSAEESAILKQESGRGLSFTDDAVENCIENNADKYMDNHKNLTVMSASLLKSKRFGTTLESVSESVCIVLLVPIKGLIPLSEEAFPTYIDGFPVDVREGSFRYKFGGKPNNKHESLKMGCAIKGDEQGTLGGFLDHNEHGICCLTAAHVMLSTMKMTAMFPGQYEPTSVESCYQPEPPNAFGRLIKAIAKEGNASETGVEVALVKIDERIPLNGRFPDAEEEKWLEAGFSPTLEMQYNTGTVLERKEIPLSSLALKFGQSTTLTDGKVRLRGCAVRNVNLHDNSEGYKYSLKKQIQVLPIGSFPFSEEGDSGSLVFIRGNDDQLSAIGMLVGGTDNYDFVTPICDILREIGTNLSLKPFPHS